MNRNSGRTWINFKELRARLKAEDVLRLYNIEPERKGEQHQGRCPLPLHSTTNSMKSFSVNLERGIFQCFGCKAKGNILEFAALMDGVDPAEGNALRKVAMKLQSKFFPEGANSRTAERPGATKPVATMPEPKLSVNLPLDFELKGLDGSHQFLTSRGYSSETIAHFGIGFCSRGSLAGRLAVPLHDDAGKLIGYAGRVVDEKEISVGVPRFSFPERRERQGSVLTFDRSLFLYNGSRIKGPCDNLIVVQDCDAVWWLSEHGYSTVVAVMGDECSDRQMELIVQLVSPHGWIWVMCDGNGLGNLLAQSLLFRTSTSRLVRRVDCGPGRRPTDLSAKEIQICFAI